MRVGCWEYPINAAHSSELVQALLGSDTERFKTVEDLRWFKWRVRKGGSETYVVQIVDEPG